jgi:signal transduction histidine kinase
MAERRRLRDPLIWLFVLTGALAILGFTDMALELGQPFGGYISYRRSAVAVGEVDANTPIWWSGIIRNRLTQEDVLLAADNQPYYPYVREAFRRAAAEGRRLVVITLTRPGIERPIAHAVHVQRFTLGQFLDVRLPDVIMFLVFWLLALVVYLSDPGNPTSRAFAFVAALVGMVRALYVHNLFMDDALATVVETFLQMSLPAVGVGILYFAANFPAPTRHSWRGIIIVAGAAAAVFTTLAVAARLPFFRPALQASFGEINYFGTLALYFLGLGALTGRFVWRLIHRRHLSRRERRVLTIVLIGLGIAMPMLLVSGLTWLNLTGLEDYYFRGLDLRYLMLSVPLTFAYALVRYRAMRSPSWLFIFVILLSSSAIVAALGAWAWAWTTPGWPENGVEPPFATLFVAAFVASLIWGGAASARGVFGRFLHYDWRAYDAVRAFGRRIASGPSNLKSLPADVAQALVDELQLERAAVWRRGDEGGKLELVARRGVFPIAPAPALVIAAETDEAERAVILSGAPLRLDRADRAPEWLRAIAGQQAFELALPLIGEEGLIGLIALGPRWDEGIFDERDLVIAELIGRQATLFFTAAANIAELRRVPGRMADAQDRERQRLAQELHDTIQQFLGRLPFYLSFSRDALATRPEKVREILDLIIADVEEEAASVRRIRQNLAPSQLERGLAGSVAALCRQFEERTGIATATEIAPEIDERTTLDVRFTIYRVMQQALDNVEAHAEASTVAVRLAAEDGHITFSVRDDGHGSTEAQRQAARERGRYGLESMRARLEAGGGEFYLHSDAAGTEVWGRLPAAG